jgi:hypothetical protein
MLNTICQIDEGFWYRLKEVRRVMLVRNIVSWPRAVIGTQISWIVTTEVLRLMRTLLPSTRHIGDAFWGGVIEIAQKSLEVIDELHYSLIRIASLLQHDSCQSSSPL